MKLSDLLKSSSSFRAQMVKFIVAMLLVATVVLSIVNQQLENRTTRVVGEYIKAIPLANDLVFRSLFKGEYLYDLVNQPSGTVSISTPKASSVTSLLLKRMGRYSTARTRMTSGSRPRKSLPTKHCESAREI